MKIKGTSGVSLKNIGITAIIVYALLTAIRIYQTFSLTDGTTGFFSANNISVPLMYILAIVPVILFAVLCFVSSDLPAGDINKKAALPSGVAGLLFALSLAFDGFSTVKIVIDFPGGDPAYLKEAIGGNVGIVSTVFAFLGALALIVQSLFSIRGKAIPSFMKIPMLFPVLWAFAKTLGFFSITVSYVKVSQLLLSIFASVFLMIFLFENARIASDIGKKDALWFFYATGIVAAGLALASAVPGLLAALFAPEKECIYSPFEFYALAGGIYALSQIIFRSNTATEDEAICENTNNTVTETE